MHGLECLLFGTTSTAWAVFSSNLKDNHRHPGPLLLNFESLHAEVAQNLEIHWSMIITCIKQLIGHDWSWLHYIDGRLNQNMLVQISKLYKTKLYNLNIRQNMTKPCVHHLHPQMKPWLSVQKSLRPGSSQRDSTTRLDGRPEVDPFWAYHYPLAMNNIAISYAKLPFIVDFPIENGDVP